MACLPFYHITLEIKYMLLAAVTTVYHTAQKYIYRLPQVTTATQRVVIHRYRWVHVRLI
ncbi:hypothetical protein NMYAN_10024 [Nitrosomonas nitrosa]|uniref:Uncharacterized protein n=1 Tax=Nitrosomonas nitrosa TaxID=52442 RepID=A0A8H8YXG5_9PROT|nr:hypothetical protein NMYAN_10024 [Nitrosomonas nitrosa]